MSKVSIEQINETLDRVAQRLDKMTEDQQRYREAQQKIAEAQQRDREAQQIRQKELDRLMAELKKSVNKFIGESSSKWGKFVEILASSNAMRLLNDRGIKIEAVSTGVQDTTPNRRWEIDVLAINGKEYVAIEVKNYLKKEDVDKFIKVLHDFKQQYKDCANKVLYGGVAYLKCEEKIDKYAEKKGLFVFQATGNSAVLNNKPDFKPTPIQNNITQ